MENTFFCQWFKGFEKGLDEMDLDSRDCLLKHCAKCCADTGVLQSYLKLYQTVNGERDAFYSRLSFFHCQLNSSFSLAIEKKHIVNK